jgi:hypothetical protein
MIDPDLSCKEENRREAVRQATLFGLDYIEVSDDQLTLTVFFLGRAPAKIEKQNVVISGGQRITGIKVKSINVVRQSDHTLDDSMDVHVNRAGDFSTYTLSVVALDAAGQSTSNPMDGFDPIYSSACFTFKGSCPTGLDCKPQHICPPTQVAQPEISYLAKDYESFRQLILDRLALTMPKWTETHVPDIGIALVEVLAYVGDYLSYYQDAVATEAYLGTSRLRISVRRHARLVDYAMHDGCNARAWVTVATDTDQQFPVASMYFITGYPGAPANRVLTTTDLEYVSPTSYEVFEPLLPASGTFSIYAAHTTIHFYTWGDTRCCLATGATSATLVDSAPTPPPQTPPQTPAGSTPGGSPSTVPASPPSAHADGRPPAAQVQTQRATPPPKVVPPTILHLNVGDVLIFEEILGPNTGNPADADPTHRQVVRLTKVTPTVDTLYNQPVVEIEWANEDALTFPLCLTAQIPNCTIAEVSVARGNVMLVDYGAIVPDEALGVVPTESTSAPCPSPCHPSEIQITAGKFRAQLAQQPLTFSQPISPSACSAAELIVQDPRQAMPNIVLSSIPPAPGCAPVTGPPVPCVIPPLFTSAELTDPTSLAKQLKQPTDPNLQFLIGQLSAATQKLLAAYDGVSALPSNLSLALIADFTAMLQTWFPVRDLLESGPNDRSFVVEMDNCGYGHLRFGDGELGYMPDAGAAFQSQYRTGNGTTGNVGAEKIQYLVLQEALSGPTITPRNPLAASGGVDPEPISEVKLLAPYAFLDTIERAITADDYSTIASDNSRRMAERPVPRSGKCDPPFVQLQGAKTTLRWTGGWYEALVALDPVGAEQSSGRLRREVKEYLEPYRRIGHDLTVQGAQYVPLDLALNISVLPDYLRGQVEEELLQVFSNSVLPNGTKGFFHPDNLTFGAGIDVSQIVAAAQGVTGVASVTVKRLQRYLIFADAHAGLPAAVDRGVPPLGVLTLGPFEIAQLDNDPSYPENGRLSLTLSGGR